MISDGEILGSMHEHHNLPRLVSCSWLMHVSTDISNIARGLFTSLSV